MSAMHEFLHCQDLRIASMRRTVCSSTLQLPLQESHVGWQADRLSAGLT